MMLALILAAGVLDFLANWAAAHWLVHVWFLVFPAGTLVFPLTFTIYDALRRFFGRAATVPAIGLGFAASLVYATVFGGAITRIAVAGLIAQCFSGPTDYLMQGWTLRLPLTRYIVSCNAVSLAVDTAIFTAVAFAPLPLTTRLQIAASQYAVKLLVSVASAPVVAWARRLAPTPAPALRIHSAGAR